tara:strand:- start:532 stop:828 length:297 start_codon:yes stop_codon:yes gene_type:complete
MEDAIAAEALRMNDREIRGRARRLQQLIDAELARRGVVPTRNDSGVRYVPMCDEDDIIDAEFVEHDGGMDERLRAFRNKMLTLIALAMLCGVVLGAMI